MWVLLLQRAVKVVPEAVKPVPRCFPNRCCSLCSMTNVWVQCSPSAAPCACPCCIVPLPAAQRSIKLLEQPSGGQRAENTDRPTTTGQNRRSPGFVCGSRTAHRISVRTFATLNKQIACCTVDEHAQTLLTEFGALQCASTGNMHCVSRWLLEGLQSVQTPGSAPITYGGWLLAVLVGSHSMTW